MNVITSVTPAVTAADQLHEVLVAFAARPVLLMLSGGSAVTILKHVDVSLFGSHVTITTLDERFSTDPAINTFAHIASTDFYRKAVEQGAQTISTLVGADETLAEAGEHFGTALHSWRENHRDGVIIATMGVGSDGHTAGIFPHQASLDPETPEWVAAYEIPPEVNPHPMRFTVTPTFLKTQVTHAICLITGAEKRSVLQRLHSADCTPTITPACILKDMSSVAIVTELS